MAMTSIGRLSRFTLESRSLAIQFCRVNSALLSAHRAKPPSRRGIAVQTTPVAEDQQRLRQKTDALVQKPIRTLFYVPASSTKKLEKAWGLSVDNVVCTFIDIIDIRLWILKIRLLKEIRNKR
jgi:hypothetical protein